MSGMFAIPKKLMKTRIFGRLDYEDEKRKKLIDAPDFFDEEIVINEAHMPKQTVLKEEPETRPALGKASPNVLTIIGVQPFHLIYIQKYFQNKGLICQFDKETVTGELGNWTVVTLNKNIEEIPEIEFQTQFGPNIFGACYIGRYREEQVEAIKSNKFVKEVPNIFREHHNAEDLTSMPLDEKSALTVFREFVIGEKEIRVKDE